MFLRRSAFFFIPYESNFYMISYIALFYTSFLYHAIKTPEYFGRLIISDLLLQAFGTLAYLGGVCGRGRNPTLRIWASDIPRLDRSEERCVGKECGSTCSSRGSPYHL